MPIQETLVLFTRYPVPGESKTRLIPALGNDGAAEIHRLMTQTILSKLQNGGTNSLCTLEVCYTGGTLELMQTWLGTSISLTRQIEGDLGCRMGATLTAHHRQGRAVCIIGSDCPSITSTIIDEAFTSLTKCDLVIGPCHDGGYYLIGCNPALAGNVIPALFSEIKWGGPQVLNDTIKNIAAAGKSCHLLPTLHDIDTPEDLRHFDYHPSPE